MSGAIKSPHSREPFNAFVSDDETLALVRSVVSDLGWSVERCNKGGLRNAVQTLSVSASPNILFVDLSESGDPINDINGLAEVCEPGTVVIAAGQINDVRLYRDLLASGIQDYLLKPLTADQLRDSFSLAQSMLATPKQAGDAAEKPRHLMAVVGVRGGVGASMVSTSLAWMISTDAGKHTALLDLDIHFGTGALTLDVDPGRGLIDAVDNPSRIDGLFIERSLVRVTDHLSVLSAEAPVNQPVLTDGAAYFHLEEELRNAFEVTIVDLPRQVLLPSPHLVSEAGTILLVTEITLAAARDTIRMLSWFKQNAPRARVVLVANKAQSSLGEMSRKEFESSIERGIDIILPFDPRLISQAAKLGKSYAEVVRGTKAAGTWRDLMLVALDDGESDLDLQQATKPSGSLLQKLGLGGKLGGRGAA
jgi:pilus assembly protein CpaE